MSGEKFIETDGDFFEEMKQMEREILRKNGDEEGLAYLDEEEKRIAQEQED